MQTAPTSSRRVALLVALMVFLSIAYRLLFLRSVARSEPGASAKIALTLVEIDVLRLLRARVPAAPTIKDVILRSLGCGLAAFETVGEPVTSYTSADATREAAV
jgi:hypothetical protein